MIVDSHIHSPFSMDSGQSFEEIHRTLEKKKMKGVLTDHYDFDHAQGDYFSYSTGDFLKTVEGLRSKRILKGIEMGLRPELRAKHEEHAALRRFDYLLGSVHFAYREGELIDFTHPTTLDLVPFYYFYLSNVLRAIEDNGFIHALAHLDYPARYQAHFGGEIPLGAVADLLNRCFRAMARREISLEINTARLGKKIARNQWKWLLRSFRENGGEHVTLGSDAHVAEDIGRHFDIALKLAKEAHLIPVYYKGEHAIEMKEEDK